MAAYTHRKTPQNRDARIQLGVLESARTCFVELQAKNAEFVEHSAWRLLWTKPTCFGSSAAVKYPIEKLVSQPWFLQWISRQVPQGRQQSLSKEIW